MIHCLSRFLRVFYACSAGFLLPGMLLSCSGMVYGDEVAKTIFLVSEPDRVTAANAETGQFFDFVFSAKERVEQRFEANGVAVLVTNQRLAGVGVFPTGWHSTRRRADETIISAEAVDYSAVIVTSDRVLTFNGKTGAWSFTDR